jgi:hypothetical protein
VFLLVAFSTHQGEGLFVSNGAFALGKPIVWLIWLGFVSYSISISSKENFFASLKKLHPFLWHRQIGLDLYIGLLIPLTIIFLHEGSLIIMLFWLAPILVFANLATLVYIGLNYDSLIAHFIS